MRKTVGIIALIAVLLPPILVASPGALAGEAQDASSKIGGLLALQVDAKLHQLEIESVEPPMDMAGPQSVPCAALGTGNLQKQQVFIHFEQEPTSVQIGELESLGVSIHPDTWIPPLENHPTGFVMASMPVDKLNDVAALGAVASLNTAEVMNEPHNDLAAAATNADYVWDTLGRSGTGVKVAVIDSGFDLNHPDFPGTETFSYWDYYDLDDDVANCTGASCSGHGTHVAGTVLGRGTSGSPTGIYRGSAYEATPVLLKIGGNDSSSASSGTMVAAIQGAVDTYDADVITMSYGSWSNHHDGSDEKCQAVDYAVSQGVPVFISAGNSGDDGMHYSGTVSASDWTGLIQVDVSNDPGTNTCLLFNLVWYEGSGSDNDLDLYFYDGSGTLTRSVYSEDDSPRNTTSEHSFHTTSDGSYTEQLVGNGTYYLRVHNNSGSSQDYHLYYNSVYNTSSSPAVTFDSPYQNYTIDSPAEADGAIAVGSYNTRQIWYDWENGGWWYGAGEPVGQISGFSSRGPRIDGAAKPNIVAPGQGIISCRDDDVYPFNSQNQLYISNWGPNENSATKNPGETGADKNNYYMMQGTSMACPHVAGIAALLLEAHPGWTPDQIRHALESTAVDKGDASWDNIYGWGLVDAQAAIGETDSVPTIVSCNCSGVETNAFASGETVYVKGSGLEASTSYNLWIQPGTVTESTSLVAANDPSSSIESVATSGTGSFVPTAIWSPSLDNGSYDIVVDQQGSGSGTYNAIDDGIDGIDAVGFVVPVPEIAIIIMMGIGLAILGGFVWLRSRKRDPVVAG